jgi:ribonuclease T1
MRRSLWIIAALLLLGLWLWSGLHAPSPPAMSTGSAAPSVGTSLPALPHPAPASVAPEVRGDASPYPAFLPSEAHDVLQRIARGGPFEYRQDGGVFQNRERRLPSQPRGYYREYTVETPGAHDRGPRRLVTGGDPPIEYWYTDDHYRSFRGFKVRPAQVRQ